LGRTSLFTAALIISLQVFSTAFAQGSIDSLEHRLTASNGLGKIKVLNHLSGLYRTSFPEKSLKYGKEALELSREADNPEWTCISLKNTGIACSYLGRYKAAEKYFKESLQIAKSNELNDQLAPAYNSLGNYYYLTGDLDKAIDYYELAYKSAKEAGSSPELNSYINNIGIIYQNRGSYDKALKYYLESLDLSEKNKDKTGISRALTNIGAVYNDRVDYSKALDYYNQALAVADETGDLHTRASLLNNIANIYSAQGDLEKALEFHINSLDINKKIDDQFGTAVSLGDIGRIYAALGRYPSAIKYLKNSITIQQKIGNTEGEIISLIQIGRAYTDMNKFEEALSSFNEAASLAKNFNAKLHLDAYKGKSELYEKKGDYRNAYESYVKYSNMEDSLFTHSSSDQIAELQARYESEKKDKEIALLQRKKKISELESVSAAMLRNSLIAGLMVFIIIAFLLYNRYRIKKNTNRLLEEKILEINEQKNELKVLSENKDKLLSIISHDLRAPFQALLGYSEMLNHNIKDLSDEEISAYAENLNQTSRQTFMLFENLLEWARLQMDKIISIPANFKLAEAVEKTSSLLMHNAVKKGITIKTDIPESSYVYADEEMISSVLRNLLSNAIKYSVKGGLVIIKSVSNSEHVDVIVEDSGTGLTHDKIQRILEGKGSTSMAGTANEKGTGLGLEICKEMISLNKGDFRIESEMGKGSRFIFTIPKSSEQKNSTNSSYLLTDSR